MNKNFTHYIFIFISVVASAQMKIGKNPTNININANFQSESVSGKQYIITKDSSKVGIGTLAPTNQLHVYSDLNPLRLEGIETNNNASYNLLVTDPTGVVKQTSRDSMINGMNIPRLLCIIQKTNQQAFSDAASGVLDFNVASINPGNSFNLSSDFYTIPNNGVYDIKLSGKVSITGGVSNSSTGHITFNFEVQRNGSSSWVGFYNLWSRPVITNVSDLPSGSVLYNFGAGDKIRISIQNCNGCGTKATISDVIFSSTLILRQ